MLNVTIRRCGAGHLSGTRRSQQAFYNGEAHSALMFLPRKCLAIWPQLDGSMLRMSYRKLGLGADHTLVLGQRSSRQVAWYTASSRLARTREMYASLLV